MVGSAKGPKGNFVFIGPNVEDLVQAEPWERAVVDPREWSGAQNMHEMAAHCRTNVFFCSTTVQPYDPSLRDAQRHAHE